MYTGRPKCVGVGVYVHSKWGPRSRCMYTSAAPSLAPALWLGPAIEVYVHLVHALAL